MFSTLLGCALTLGQVPDRSEWLLAPQYVKGVELVYTGAYTEKSFMPGIEHKRDYRLENTIFLMDADGRHWDVAIMTSLGLKSFRNPKDKEAGPSSVRLEIGEVDKHGRLRGKKGASLNLPLDGPPTIETGAFLEFAPSRVGKQQSWSVTEEGRPPRTWHVAGTEQKNGSMCLKLIGEQQSDDWDRPRPDHTAWRRRDTVWILPQLGIPTRVERVLERRDPARRNPSFVAEAQYDLSSQLRYPGKLYDDRADEIHKAERFLQEARALWQKPAQYRLQLDALLKKIQFHIEGHTQTPYRKAILQVQRNVEKARRGETPIEAVSDDGPAAVPAVKVGQRAPDFLVSELTGNQTTARLYRLLGRPVLIAFYNPATEAGKETLRFLQSVHDRTAGQVNVLAMAATSDADLVRKQHQEMHLPFPVMDGNGMRVTFGADATPRFVVLDADGIVRGAYTGWADHVPREISSELQSWLPKR
jgi:peroxiredoxin